MSICSAFFYLDDEDLENKIKSIIREHHFGPSIIDAFFLDAIDYNGLDFYYNDIKEVNREIENK